MNRYYMIRRLRAPILLLLLGTMAILAQMHIFPWHRSWPLILIYFGVMMLVERAMLAIDGYPNAFPSTTATEGTVGVSGGSVQRTANDLGSSTVTVTTTGSTDAINTGSKGVQL